MHKINILHLYPDLLNLYGDDGNIACLKMRLLWRGIDVEVTKCLSSSDNDIDFSNVDIVFMGGGSDREQQIVCQKLLAYKSEIIDYVEQGGVLVAVCGGYQLLGKYYKTADALIEGLSVLNIYTEAGETRLIGNVVLSCDFIREKIENDKAIQPDELRASERHSSDSSPGDATLVVGFENHAGRTHIGNHTPLGKIVKGHGNNGEDGFEGVLYKGVIGTYLHGPLLPKNPQLCDYILSCALKKKYADFVKLTELDDSLENAANKAIRTLQGM